MTQNDIFESLNACDVIDISQPISRRSVCFPGDTAFSYEVTESYADSKIANVSAFTMSPHVCTHADAPSHMRGIIGDEPVEGLSAESIGRMPLRPYVGPVTVIDVAPFTESIFFRSIKSIIEGSTLLQKRVLFKTRKQEAFKNFDAAYANLTCELIDKLFDMGVELVGIDTPSVDQNDSTDLEVHNRLLKHKMYWLENLDLTEVKAGHYCLIALPLKFMELEASPVRAALLNFR